MTHKETRTAIDEWTVDVCDDCGHEVRDHYDIPKDIYYTNGKYMYTAEGCMVLAGTRKLKGDNRDR